MFNAGECFTVEEFKTLCEVYEHKCFYCGLKVKVLVPDHITPISKNGKADINNIAPACVSCNSGKRNKTGEEYIKWREDVGLCVRKTYPK
jgi:5-methylcytosine-specific restriction endonuclease McrA